MKYHFLIATCFALSGASAVADPPPASTSQYRASPPTLANQQTIAPQVDVNGNAKVAVSGTVPTNPVTPPLAYNGTHSATIGTSSAVLFTPGTFTRVVTIATLPGSTTNVWLRTDGTASVVGTGALVQAGGGSYTFGTPDAPMPTANVTAITDSGSSQVVLINGG